MKVMIGRKSSKFNTTNNLFRAVMLASFLSTTTLHNFYKDDFYISQTITTSK